MHTNTVFTSITRTALVLALGLTGCDEPLEQSEAVDAHEASVEDAEQLGDAEVGVDSVRGDEAVEGVAPSADLELASGEPTPGSAVSVVFFRLMSKQLRNATSEALCFEPLDNVAGAPVLQRACTNSPLSTNNRQAFFQTTTLGYRIQYAFKDRLTGQDLCLHPAGGMKAISDGAAIVLYQCDGLRTNQILYASAPDASGAIALMPAHSHRCLSVFGGLDSDLTLLYQFSLYTGAASCTALHQRWYLRTEQGGQYDWTQIAPECWTAPMCVL